MLAVIAFFICNSIASIELVASGQSAVPAEVAGRTLVKVIASFGQFILPPIFVIAAIASALAQLGRRTIASSTNDVSPLPPRPYQPEPARKEATVIDQLSTDIYPVWTADLAEEPPSVPIDVTKWSMELLRNLEWKRFEMVCAGLFERLGFTTTLATVGPDGGVDILLSKEGQPVAVVQCKAWTGSSKVGVRSIRELHSVMVSKSIAEGIFATTTAFSDDAKAWAKASHIDLMDGDTILESIARLTEQQQKSLLQLATAGDYTTPTCPSCGIKMTTRKKQSDGSPFWGCRNYPRCRSIINKRG